MLEYKIIGEIYQYFVNSNKYFSNVGKSGHSCKYPWLIFVV